MKAVDLELQKIGLILSPDGPLWNGQRLAADAQVEKLNAMLPSSHVGAIKRNTIYNWMKGDGLRRPDNNPALQALCVVLKKINGPAAIQAHDFTDSKVAIEQFAKKLGIGECRIGFILYSFALNCTHLAHAFPFLPDINHDLEPAQGMFRLQRYRDADRKRPSSTCLLVIDKPLIWQEAARSAPFVTLYAPTGNKNKPHAIYTGLLARYGSTIYLSLHSAPGAPVSDMCQLILEPSDAASLNHMAGYYLSANIEGIREPAPRYVRAERISMDVTDDSLKRHRAIVKITSTARTEPSQRS